MKRPITMTFFAILLALGLWSLMPSQTAYADTCTWTGGNGTSWTDSANWSGCATAPPTSADDAVIPDVSGGSNTYPVINSDVVITNLTINASATLVVNTGSLTINGNFVCNGSFTATGRPVTFSGVADQAVSGSGTATFGSITVNSSAATNIVNISMAPSGAFDTDNGFLTLTQGILEFSGSYTFSKDLFSSSDYTIGTNAGLWLNNSNATLSSPLGSTYLQGHLQVTAGTLNIGDAVNESLIFESDARLVMEGGAMNVAGIFAGNPGGEPYASISITGGIFTIGTVPGFSSSLATFNAQGFTNIETTGGTVVIQNENTGSGNDMRIVTGGGWSPAGGTIQFGNASTSGSPTFEIDTPSLPSVAVVSNGSNAPSVTLVGYYLTVYGSLSVGANTTFQTGAYGTNVAGNGGTPADMLNNGIFISNNFNVVNILTNNGMLSQTLTVDGTNFVPFLRTGGYGGLLLNANGLDLGVTTVTIRGNQDCTTVPGETVQRCLDINPTNKTGRDAMMLYYFADSELSGNTCGNLGIYHFNGSSWDLIPGPGFDCTQPLNSVFVSHLSSFSPFVLKEGSPTAITLRNMTAQNNIRVSVLLFIAILGFSLASAMLWYVRKHKMQ